MILTASQLRRKRRDRAWKQWRARADALEKRLQFHLRKYFVTERARVMRVFNRLSLRAAEIDDEDDDVEPFVLPVSLAELQKKLQEEQQTNNEEWAALLLLLLLLMAKQITSMMVFELGFEPDDLPTSPGPNQTLPEKTETWTKAFLAGALALISASILKKILTVVAQAQQKPQSLTQTINQINQIYATFIKSKAPGIAGNMVGTVASMAQQIAILSLPVPIEDLRQTWVSMRDEKVRDSHQELDGVERTVGDEFKPGLKFPRDPNAPIEEKINCRCWLMVAQIKKKKPLKKVA